MPDKYNKKTLGICIPTYKRPEYLKNCILSAIKYAENIPIKIFVVDDSVSDVNEPFINELKAKHDFIVYIKNSVNIGIDDNIQKCVDVCDCDYAWIIGEDDLFLPGSIKRINDIVQDNNFDFIVSNYFFSSEDHSTLLSKALSTVVEGPMPTHEFIENYLWSIGFIGACVIKMEQWKKTYPEVYKGTYYTHVGRILNIISKSADIYISEEPNVANRAAGEDTFTWKKDSFGVFLGFEKMCNIVAQNDSTISSQLLKAIATFRKKTGYFSIKTLLRLRAEQSYDHNQYKKYIVNSDLGFIKKGGFFLISVIPSMLLTPLVYINKKIKKQ